MKQEHRTYREVVLDILKAIRKTNEKGIGKTNLMYISNTSPQMTKHYYKILSDNKLIEEKKSLPERYQKEGKMHLFLTKLGIEFLIVYDRLNSEMNILEEMYLI
jgi:predicted transcriptional regulator